jgi:hypothetical protein
MVGMAVGCVGYVTVSGASSGETSHGCDPNRTRLRQSGDSAGVRTSQACMDQLRQRNRITDVKAPTYLVESGNAELHAQSVQLLITAK